MKTVLISGKVPVPAALRDLIRRGSTALVERRAADLAENPAVEADRIVLWNGEGDEGLRVLAEMYGNTERIDRRERVMFVTAEEAAATEAVRLPADELYLWPRDEDRLKMAFLTGA